MRKDILWEPFWFLSKHLPGSVSGWSEFYAMPIRMRNWLIERTIENHKQEQAAQEADATGKKNLEGGEDADRTFKDFKAF